MLCCSTDMQPHRLPSTTSGLWPLYLGSLCPLWCNTWWLAWLWIFLSSKTLCVCFDQLFNIYFKWSANTLGSWLAMAVSSTRHGISGYIPISWLVMALISMRHESWLRLFSSTDMSLSLMRHQSQMRFEILNDELWEIDSPSPNVALLFLEMLDPALTDWMLELSRLQPLCLGSGPGTTETDLTWFLLACSHIWGL